jgi:heat shock protein HslJ
VRPRAAAPVLAGLLLAVTLVACSSDDGGGSGGQASTDPGELVGPTWTLDEATRGALAEQASDVSADVTLSFAEDGTVSGSAGCNTYSGSYETDDQGGMSFGPFASTTKACDEATMALEGNYLRTLGQASAFAIDEGTLILQAANVQLSYAS